MKKISRNLSLLILIIALFSNIINAQEIGRQRGPEFVSPEVADDNRISFKVHSPNANSISLQGSWMCWGETADLKKGSGDIWSIMVGPLEPSMYHYNFIN